MASPSGTKRGDAASVVEDCRLTTGVCLSTTLARPFTETIDSSAKRYDKIETIDLVTKRCDKIGSVQFKTGDAASAVEDCWLVNHVYLSTTLVGAFTETIDSYANRYDKLN
jgi:hypothetical protein